ncbi:hypothetical protein [Nocardia australiensis]|nr:hypothetical protein [Nocardia australiensis]
MFITDHPGWLSTDDGIDYRAVTSGNNGALITVGRRSSVVGDRW